MKDEELRASVSERSTSFLETARDLLVGVIGFSEDEKLIRFIDEELEKRVQERDYGD